MLVSSTGVSKQAFAVANVTVGFATQVIGLVGFEPTACRRGDRSTIPDRAHLYLVRSCNIARVAPLRSEWRSFRCGLEPTALQMFRRLGITSVVAANALSQILARTHVASPGFSAAQRVTIKHSPAIGNHIGLVGFEPTASWSRTRRSTKLSHSPNCSLDLPRKGGARPYFVYFATPGKRFSLPCIQYR